MYEFRYQSPKAVAEALTLLAEDGDAMALAGGMTLLPTLKQRLRAPSQLVDLARIPGLAGITVEGDVLAIGAMTRHADVAASPAVQAHTPALAYLAGQIGDPQVRHRGTIGGSVANNDPAADYPAGVLALNATIVTDRREVEADNFFTGMFTTALEPGELITAVRFPRAARAAYQRFQNPVSRYPLVGLFLADFSGDIRVAITGAGDGVFRWTEAERTLAGRLSVEAARSVRLSADRLNADLHASADYRAHLAGVMLERAVASLL